MWLKIRQMNNVERASLAHSIPGYALLTPQVITIGDDPENAQICKFSRIFGPDTTQEETFHSVRHYVGRALFGDANTSVICYGSTGLGKTHTLSGAEWKKSGII